jgi:uncharacterized repeat protein (TIGR04076 family)
MRTSENRCDMVQSTRRIVGPPWGGLDYAEASPEYDVIVRVTDIVGERMPKDRSWKGCPIVKVGDEFSVIGPRLEIDPKKMKGDICVPALHSIWPYIQAMRFGAEFSWADKSGRAFACCPDPDGLVVFEVKKGKILQKE